MSKRSTGARFNLGEPWDGMLADFCAAHYDASATAVVRAALEEFIPARLDAAPEMKKRFDDAQKARNKNAQV